MIDWPVGKHGAPVNVTAGHRPKHPRIIRADAVIAHHEITVLGNAHRPEIAQILVLPRHIRLGHNNSIDVNRALADLHGLATQAHDSFDERFRAVERIPEHYDVAALDGLEAVDKLVDEDAFLVGKQRGHAGAFDLYGLIEENDDDQGKADGDQQVAGPHAKFVAQGMQRSWP